MRATALAWFSALTESTEPIGGRATRTSGCRGPRGLDDGVADGAAEDDQAVAATGHLADGGLGVAAAVGGQDQDGAAQLGGHGLVAQDDLGVVGAGQVGEDDAVGGVAALGELPAELAGGVLQLGGRGQDPVAGVGRGRPRSRASPGRRWRWRRRPGGPRRGSWARHPALLRRDDVTGYSNRLHRLTCRTDQTCQPPRRRLPGPLATPRRTVRGAAPRAPGPGRRVARSPGFAPYQYSWFRDGSFIAEGASAAGL